MLNTVTFFDTDNDLRELTGYPEMTTTRLSGTLASISMTGIGALFLTSRGLKIGTARIISPG